MPAVQQESERDGQCVWRMMMDATVVFPHPGGPKRMIEGGGSFSNRVRKTAPDPNKS